MNKCRVFWVSFFTVVNPVVKSSTGVVPVNSPPFNRTYDAPTMTLFPLSCVSPAGLK